MKIKLFNRKQKTPTKSKPLTRQEWINRIKLDKVKRMVNEFIKNRK